MEYRVSTYVLVRRYGAMRRTSVRRQCDAMSLAHWLCSIILYVLSVHVHTILSIRPYLSRNRVQSR